MNKNLYTKLFAVLIEAAFSECLTCVIYFIFNTL